MRGEDAQGEAKGETGGLKTKAERLAERSCTHLALGASQSQSLGCFQLITFYLSRKPTEICINVCMCVSEFEYAREYSPG